MASISTTADGNLTIQFLIDGKRRTVWLGKMKPAAADKIKTNVEFIIEDDEQGDAHSAELVKWMRGLGDKLHAKLAKKGLFAVRASAKQTTLGPWIDRCIDGDQKAKPGSKEVWRQGKLGLIAFFGADKPLSAITPGMADDFKLALESTDVTIRGQKPGDKKPRRKLASMTVRKRLQFAKKVFRAAVRHKLIEDNPFDDVKVEAAAPDRKYNVSPADTAKLVAACPPGTDWPTIIALARWGGLRCPSEVLSLKITDIHWPDAQADTPRDRTGWIRITSPKTAHHPGKESRIIPMFPELHEPLLRAAEAAPEGAVYVVDERFRKSAMGIQGWRNCNLRTTFEKIIVRAGLTPWPRLFHNLRSSRQTELQEKFPTHVVCAWLGNSPDIAREHYLQTTDEHFERAAGNPLQKPVQYDPVSASNESSAVSESGEIAGEYDGLLHCTSVQSDGEGFEPTVDFHPRRFSRPVP